MGTVITGGDKEGVGQINGLPCSACVCLKELHLARGPFFFRGSKKNRHAAEIGCAPIRWPVGTPISMAKASADGISVALFGQGPLMRPGRHWWLRP